MQTTDQNAVAEKMRQTLADFLPTLHKWTRGEENRMIDPFETEYSENYAPANAAVIYASVYAHRRDSDALQSVRTMVERSAILLQDREGVSPFCRVFLLHYSLLAILLLPEEERQAFGEAFKDIYANYMDDCGQVNTNCAALQWGIELFIDALGYRSADVDYMRRLLDFIQSGQNNYGFINDDMSPDEHRDGMPIAYHAFTMFILTTALVAVELWQQPFLTQRDDAEAIVRKGMDWLQHAVTSDGTFAMIERSRYQMFTWGAFVALQSYTNPHDVRFLDKAFDAWIAYRHEDGSYSCTPNHLAHELRTGFERYTHVNMYNNLGLIGIAIAERILSRGKKLQSGGDLSKQPADNHFIDPQSGYAFVRRENDFFGCALRMHERKYAPAMQGFHFRLDGQPLPIAEAAFLGYGQRDQTFLINGVWEGFLLKDEGGQLYYPDVSENVGVVEVDNGIEMTFDTADVHCQKRMTLSGKGIEWRYTLTPKRPFAFCEHILPVLVYDGTNGIRVTSHDAQHIEFTYGDRHYVLTNQDAVHMNLSLKRSLTSVSGVASLVHMKVGETLQPDQAIEWRTVLRVMG